MYPCEGVVCMELLATLAGYKNEYKYKVTEA
jgi:hypothetical protein